MKFAVLGATGPSGQTLIDECLTEGHQVVALVRNPDKLTVKHDNLTVEKVNIFQEEELVPHFRGVDAVFSCLGSYSLFWKSCTLYTDSIKPITDAMREAGVSRIVAMSASGSKGKEVLSVEGQAVPQTSMTIPRRDVVKFMLKCVTEGLWKKKCVAVGIK